MKISQKFCSVLPGFLMLTLLVGSTGCNLSDLIDSKDNEQASSGGGGGASGGGGMAESAPAVIPSDFALDYHWREGSLPPPYHYEYDIEIAADGQGTIHFRPDYGSTPEWVETFSVEESDLQELYEPMNGWDFSEPIAEEEDPPVGGHYSWMEVTQEGKTNEVPAFPKDSAVRNDLEDIYGLTQALVPEEVWNDLYSRQTEFIDSYYEEMD